MIYFAELHVENAKRRVNDPPFSDSKFAGENSYFETNVLAVSLLF